MAQPDLLDEWEFRFGLCIQTPGKSIPYSDAEELMNGIVRWAEGKGYGIGGGFARFPEEEVKPLEPRDE